MRTIVKPAPFMIAMSCRDLLRAAVDRLVAGADEQLRPCPASRDAPAGALRGAGAGGSRRQPRSTEGTATASAKRC